MLKYEIYLSRIFIIVKQCCVALLGDSCHSSRPKQRHSRGDCRDSTATVSPCRTRQSHAIPWQPHFHHLCTARPQGTFWSSYTMLFSFQCREFTDQLDHETNAGSIELCCALFLLLDIGRHYSSLNY